MRGDTCNVNELESSPTCQESGQSRRSFQCTKFSYALLSFLFVSFKYFQTAISYKQLNGPHARRVRHLLWRQLITRVACQSFKGLFGLVSGGGLKPTRFMLSEPELGLVGLPGLGFKSSFIYFLDLF